MKLESDFSFISNIRGIPDDVTLVQPISNDFINQRFMISIRIYIDYVPFMIAKPYRKFEAFSITIRSCGIEILKIDAMFLR